MLGLDLVHRDSMDWMHGQLQGGQRQGIDRLDDLPLGWKMEAEREWCMGRRMEDMVRHSEVSSLDERSPMGRPNMDMDRMGHRLCLPDREEAVDSEPHLALIPAGCPSRRHRPHLITMVMARAQR